MLSVSARELHRFLSYVGVGCTLSILRRGSTQVSCGYNFQIIHRCVYHLHHSSWNNHSCSYNAKSFLMGVNDGTHHRLQMHDLWHLNTKIFFPTIKILLSHDRLGIMGIVILEKRFLYLNRAQVPKEIIICSFVNKTILKYGVRYELVICLAPEQVFLVYQLTQLLLLSIT